MELAAPKSWTGANWLLPLAAFAILSVIAAAVEPELTSFLILGLVCLSVIAWRPYLGVAIILTMFLIEYGERRGGAFGEFVTAGSGLLTINNVIGLFLATLLMHRVYVDRDWSFLHSRQVYLMIIITVVLVLSAVWNRVDYSDLEMVGIQGPTQNPARLMISRALFLLLFVAFVRRPRELRLMVGIFLALALASALAGYSNAMAGTGFRAAVAESGYRAGGVAVLIEEARNPNRLALICSLALIFIWEYAQTVYQNWRRVVSLATVALLVLTVFLTASRGGVAGLVATGLFLLSRSGERAKRLAYAAVVTILAFVVIREFIPEPTAERLEAVPGLSEEVGGEGMGSAYRRSYGWAIAAKIAAQHPLLGVGLENWGFERFHLDPLRITTPPHNSYLLALAEGGIFTLTLYLALFWFTLRELRMIESNARIMHRAREEGLDWVIRGTHVAMLSYMVFALFGDIWVLVSFYLMLGLSGVLIHRYAPNLFSDAPA